MAFSMKFYLPALLGLLSIISTNRASADKRPSATTSVWGLPSQQSSGELTAPAIQPLPLANNADVSYSTISRPSVVTVVRRPSRTRKVVRPVVSYGPPALTYGPPAAASTFVTIPDIARRQETVLLQDVRPRQQVVRTVVRQGDDSGERQTVGDHHANMPYTYAWSVRDDSGNDYGHQETRSDAGVTSGGYRVLLPDGRLQIVEYQDNGWGYEAQVRYEGEARYDDVTRAHDDGYRV